ncbi:mechanosensitive ion channel domain-containing protein [Limibacter armeniacum]|uniref:mechanosensitive ion channel family protein n=1 Tax=Limibacter armeniacum TaxID=466084 RepID=UPI002FE67CF4
MEQVQKFIVEDLPAMVMKYGVKVIGAVALFIVGWVVINSFSRVVANRMKKRADNEALVDFIKTALNITLKVLLIVAVIGMIGIQTTSLIAALGSVGLAVGLALQGSLSNVAGGVLIVVLRPFKVGDVIQAQGEVGKVEAISLFNTTITNPQNRKVVIPNAPLSNGVITNFTERGSARFDVNIGISYDADVRVARKVLLEVIKSDERVLKDPEPQVVVNAFGDSSVDLIVRGHAKVDDYWPTYFSVMENCKIALDEHGIEIPFPQRVLHVVNSENKNLA